MKSPSVHAGIIVPTAAPPGADSLLFLIKKLAEYEKVPSHIGKSYISRRLLFQFHADCAVF
jgi:hypothetical protein